MAFWRTLIPALTLPVIAAANSGIIQVTDVRWWSQPGVTRVILDISGPAEFKADRAVNPDRIFFDVLHARPWIAQKRLASRVINDPQVQRVRIAETAPGTTRVVFDLKSRVEYNVQTLTAPDRLVIELRNPNVKAPAPVADIVTPTPAPAPVLAKTEAAKTEPPKPMRTARFTKPFVAPPVRPLQPVYMPDAPMMAAIPMKQFVLPGAAARLAALSKPPKSAYEGSTKVLPAETVTATSATNGSASKAADNTAHSLTRALGLKVSRIVIDAGHGGHDDGTIGPHGVLEKDVVLDVALRLSKLVQQKLGAEVVLTRSDDTFIPLHERTNIANEHKADLFLSIHANSSPAPVVAGTETFFLSLTNSATALDVATRENATSEKTVGELRDLVRTIALNDKVAESEAFANTVQNAIYSQAAKSNLAAKNRGVKRAPFVVLIGAGMPSVLAEIGFLSNAKDEANLNKPEYRQKIAEALFKGLSQYSQSLSHVEMAKSETPAAHQPKPGSN